MKTYKTEYLQNNNCKDLSIDVKKKEIFDNRIQGGEQLLKPEQVAMILGISVNTVYNWNYLGKLTPIIFSKRMVRYKHSDIIKLIETRETTKEVIS